jgi:hypothetical protein
METVIENGLHCLFVAKPGDHKYLFQWIEDFKQLPNVEVKDKQGRCHQYRWQNDVPLNGKQDALRVNFIEYSLINEKGKRT